MAVARAKRVVHVRGKRRRAGHEEPRRCADAIEGKVTANDPAIDGHCDETGGQQLVHDEERTRDDGQILMGKGQHEQDARASHHYHHDLSGSKAWSR